MTLGVQDVGRARKFYEALGWKASSASKPEVAFFNLCGIVFSLFGRGALAADIGISDSGPGFSGIALAHNERTKEAVDETLAQAAAAGATIVKPGQDTFWGGYAGYFADPDGHYWEIAWNPFMPLDEQGRCTLSE